MALKRVTVFGGSGFVGRHIVQRLAARGAVVRVAVRYPSTTRFLQPMGDVGQIVPIRADVRDQASVARALEGVDAAVNAVSLYVESRRTKFETIHVAGAENVARQATAQGVGRLLQISGLGLDADSESKYIRARTETERVVSAAFPGATFLRPSVIFGPEDAFFTTLASMARLSPVLPLFGGGRTRLQPVYVGDVAEAAVRALEKPATAGEVFQLGGPRVYSFRQLVELTLDTIGRRRLLLPVPFFIAERQAMMLELLPDPPLTRDQVRLLKVDNVVDRKAKGFAELGIEPVAVESELPRCLERFRRVSPAAE